MAEKRLKQILKASFVAIGVNICLGIFKAFVGVISHSIAITMDAVNNFTDAGSSLITILAAHFAAKDPDKKHPFGYGRTEYLGTLLIAGLILYTGVTAFVESVQKIGSTQNVEYSKVSLIIIAVAVVVKLLLTIYITKMGNKNNSDSLIAAGKESIGDVAISIATLIAAYIYIFMHIAIEAWLGAIISLMIVKSGLEILKETIDKILGNSGEVELVKDIKRMIATQDNVEGAYDLVLHNYGPNRYLGSVHVEVADTLSINEFDQLSRELQAQIFDEFGVYLAAIGVYASNTQNEEVVALREDVRKIALLDAMVHQMHGFYVDMRNKRMSFDIVISFDVKHGHDVHEKVLNAVQKKYPEYEIKIGIDRDFNEL